MHPWPYSAGVGPNMLLARLATKKAKPNGQCALGLLSRSAAHMSRLDATNGFKGDDEGEYPLHDSLPVSPFDTRSPHRPQQQHTERDKDKDKDKQQLLEATPADREIKEFLEALPLGELPGVGYKLDKKLKEKNLLVCGDIWNVRKESLKVRTSILRDCQSKHVICVFELYRNSCLLCLLPLSALLLIAGTY
jgi:IMS family HHH motif